LPLEAKRHTVKLRRQITLVTERYTGIVAVDNIVHTTFKDILMADVIADVVHIAPIGLYFANADFFAIFEKDQATLAADLVHKQEILLKPGETKNLQFYYFDDSVKNQYCTIYGSYKFYNSDKKLIASSTTSEDRFDKVTLYKFENNAFEDYKYILQKAIDKFKEYLKNQIDEKFLLK